jgi:DNA repair exonuclease SbcCD ATPase subunit
VSANGVAYEALPRHLQAFVDCLDNGGTLEEAARAGGSQAKTPETLKTTAQRWRDDVRVQAALAERQGKYDEVGTEEWRLHDKARKVLNEVLDDAKADVGARIKAVELVYKAAGKLKLRGDVRHMHAHLHAGTPSLAPGEESRMLSIALRGRKARCPSCGAEVPLDSEVSG